MNEDEAGKALGEFFADGFKRVSYFKDGTMAGLWWFDGLGPKTRLDDGEIESLLYLLDIYVNGE